MQRTFYRGKLLLFGEYAVVHGALALAVPSLYGQTFHVNTNVAPGISWKALDEQGNAWLELKLSEHLEIQGEADDKATFLAGVLRRAFLFREVTDLDHGYEITTQLDYPRLWGLGSSATLYAFLGDLLQVDPYTLFFATSKGSGFDIACATSETPLFYRVSEQQPYVLPAEISPAIKEKLLFVYRGNKQDSLREVSRVDANVFTTGIQDKISQIATSAAASNDIQEWIKLMNEHEEILSGIIGLEKVKPSLFPDFDGSIKSLGAWGGDFVMATSAHLTLEEMTGYFMRKGYPIVKRWNELLV